MAAPPPDERRCTWMKTSGRRCRQARTTERYCSWHEDMSVKHARALTLAQDTADVPIEQHLQLELRAATVMVKVLELQVHDLLGDEEPWIFDERETESREGGPGGGFESVRRKRVISAHPVLTQYLAERRHRVEVVKLCVQAGLAARQIAAMEKVVETILMFGNALAEALGHDPSAPEVRQRILETLQTAEQSVTETPRALEG